MLFETGVQLLVGAAERSLSGAAPGAGACLLLLLLPGASAPPLLLGAVCLVHRAHTCVLLVLMLAR